MKLVERLFDIRYERLPDYHLGESVYYVTIYNDPLCASCAEEQEDDDIKDFEVNFNDDNLFCNECDCVIERNEDD